LLDRLAHPSVTALTDSEAVLAQDFSVSRTTIRAALLAFQQTGLLNGRRRVLRRPVAADYFPVVETLTAAEIVERRFMNWILHSDIRPGQPVNVTHLARQFGVSTTVTRGYLQQLRHYGILDRRPNSTWMFRGITPAFAASFAISVRFSKSVQPAIW
jgi:DNA-binding GntR family transcriptional regulator